MPRKYDAHKDELEGVAQRLRDERPEASPLELDRIKTTAMSRAKAGSKRGRAGARRLAVASLTVGLLAAGTGGVLASKGGNNNSGNAAIAQYGSNCDVNNSNNNTAGDVSGNGNSNGNNSDNCNENSFNTNNITETNTTTNTIYNTYNNSTVTVAAAPAAAGAVQGTSTTKSASTKHPVKFRINISKKSKLKKVTLRINGKVVSVLKGKKASANISIANLPCSANGTTVTVTAVTASGKTITQSHTYHICS
jgi:hypothetical protein